MGNGKYKIGARVRHIDEEEGTVTGKAKGLRLVRFDGDEEGVWVKKQYLTPIAEPEPEWQPKVGDRVRFKEPYGSAKAGDEGKIAGLWEDDGDPRGGVYLVANGKSYSCFRYRLEPLPVAAETQGAGELPPGTYTVEFSGFDDDFNPKIDLSTAKPVGLTIQPGKFYRTRDGRRVGPAVFYDFGDGQPWCAGDRWYSPDGNWLRDGTPSHYDLIAEWVDPEPVAVAPATATQIKKGDLVTLARSAMVTGFDPNNPAYAHVVLGTGGTYTLPVVALVAAS